MTHHHIQGLDRVHRNLSGAALQRLLEGEQGDLGDPLDGDAEHPVPALAVQGHLQLHLVVADGQRILDVKVAAPVKHRFQVSKYS